MSGTVTIPMSLWERLAALAKDHSKYTGFGLETVETVNAMTKVLESLEHTEQETAK